MKKYILILAVIFSAVSFVSFNQVETIQESQVEVVACKIRQCNATAKSTGKRCKHCVSKSEDKQCWQHKPKNKH